MATIESARKLEREQIIRQQAKRDHLDNFRKSKLLLKVSSSPKVAIKISRPQRRRETQTSGKTTSLASKKTKTISETFYLITLS